MSLGTDGLRGELTLMRAARALASLDGDAGRRRCASAPRRGPGAAAPPAAQSARRFGFDDARRSRGRGGLRGVSPIAVPASGPTRSEFGAGSVPISFPTRRRTRCWPRRCSRSTRPDSPASWCARRRGRPAIAGSTRCARQLPDDTPWRRVPLGIADDRLLGGLDLAATLSAGRPVAQRGVLADAHGGVIVLPMAERLAAGTAARIAATLDAGEVALERDGFAARMPARFGALALRRERGGRRARACGAVRSPRTAGRPVRAAGGRHRPARTVAGRDRGSADALVRRDLCGRAGRSDVRRGRGTRRRLAARAVVRAACGARARGPGRARRRRRG